jgi:hypothetical protein
VFHLDVAYVVMAIYAVASVCFMLQAYVSSVLDIFFNVSSRCCKSRSGCCIYVYVASICFKCYMCFIRMFQLFHLDVAHVCNGLQVFSRCFASVPDVCCKCFSCFGRILQVLHLEKIDLVLDMLK